MANAANPYGINPIFFQVVSEESMAEYYECIEQVLAPVFIIESICAVSALICLVSIVVNPVLAAIGALFFGLCTITFRDIYSMTRRFQKFFKEDDLAIIHIVLQAPISAKKAFIEYALKNTWIMGLPVFKDRIVNWFLLN